MPKAKVRAKKSPDTGPGKAENPAAERHQGFVVHVSISYDPPRVYLTGRLADGRSFAASDSSWRPRFYVPGPEAPRAGELLSRRLGTEAKVGESSLRSFDGRECSGIETGIPSFSRAAALLRAEGIELFDADEKLKDLYLIDRGIRGGIALEGNSRPGRRVGLVFADPRISPMDSDCPLSWAAIDIETSRAGLVRAVSVAGPEGDECFFAGPDPDEPGVLAFGDERDCLLAFAERVRSADPDILSGWNVIDFDFKVLASRFRALGIPFDISRSEEEAKYLEGSGGGSAAFIVPGRQTLDAMRIVRSGPMRFEDLRLETVAHAVLGEGKLIAGKAEAKLDELDRLFAEEPGLYCRYCMRDARLVLEILSRTGLDALTIKRASSTGAGIDRAWTSIPPFERLYALRLRARGILQPPKTDRRLGPSPGGLILDPLPGLFHSVLVLDFKSLYPSLIRTFNIDPLSHLRADSEDVSERGTIETPNGARFSREPGILPEIIGDWYARREEARKRGDAVETYVYKILMNSFYGVLGARGCRYASPELAGAVTSCGQKILLWTRDWAEARGYRVLYGDTDSIFLESGLEADAWNEALLALGARLARELNAELPLYLSKKHNIASFLEIKLEKAYESFFIPRLKANPDDEDPRGRAKGYAGSYEDKGERIVEIKGMEAARSDGTELGRRFQRELLALLFEGKGEEEMRAFIERRTDDLLEGRLDGELVYKKVLRRSPEEYTKVEPPQVRAARLLGWRGRRGRIEYLITTEGAQPESMRTAPIDREHYLKKQLLPIAESVGESLGLSLLPECLTGRGAKGQEQLELGF